MTTFKQIILFTGSDGRARFREESLPLSEGAATMQLSPLRASDGYQLRHSPIGFRSPFHCTLIPQWVFILQGQMEIGLQDGSFQRHLESRFRKKGGGYDCRYLF